MAGAVGERGEHERYRVRWHPGQGWHAGGGLCGGAIERVAGIGEHYVAVDFTGWRYFELIESEGERYANYTWPYGGAYSIYRERVDYKQVAQLNVWINNLPANGTVKCYLSPVRATPLVKAKIRNPRVTVDCRTLLLPVEMESGSYLEFNSPTDCKFFGPDGSVLQELKIEGAAPILGAGVTQLHFDCEAAPGVNPRVRITSSAIGEPLTPTDAVDEGRAASRCLNNKDQNQK